MSNQRDNRQAQTRLNGNAGAVVSGGGGSRQDPTRLSDASGPADRRNRTTALQAADAAIEFGTRVVVPNGVPDSLKDNYEFVRELAAGGQSYLRVVNDTATGSEVVMKLYDRTPRAEIEETLTAAQQLGFENKNLVKVLKFGWYDEGKFYEIQEYYTGGRLSQFTGDGLRLSVTEVTELVRQMTKALSGLHSINLIHKDVKPQNIMLASELGPKRWVLVDLGTAKDTGGATRIYESRIAGTEIYQSPEQLSAGLDPDGKTVDITRAVDWWALGLVLLELLDKHPYVDANGRALPPASISVTQTRYGTPATDGVEDERLKMLISGLLAISDRERWGEKQVKEWLGGGSPRLSSKQRATEQINAVPLVEHAAEMKPISLANQVFRSPAEVAASISSQRSDSWPRALSGPNMTQLINWIRQEYPQKAAALEALQANERAGVIRQDRLSSEVAFVLNPELGLSFRGIALNHENIYQQAVAAVKGSKEAQTFLQKLREDNGFELFSHHNDIQTMQIGNDWNLGFSEIEDRMRFLPSDVKTGLTARMPELSAQLLMALMNPQVAGQIHKNFAALSATKYEKITWFSRLLTKAGK